MSPRCNISLRWTSIPHEFLLVTFQVSGARWSGVNTGHTFTWAAPVKKPIASPSSMHLVQVPETCRCRRPKPSKEGRGSQPDSSGPGETALARLSPSIQMGLAIRVQFAICHVWGVATASKASNLVEDKSVSPSEKILEPHLFPCSQSLGMEELGRILEGGASLSEKQC